MNNCKQCNSTMKDCDARLRSYPKRCCPACKEDGPQVMHR